MGKRKVVRNMTKDKYDLELHENHEIVEDIFSKLQGVQRFVEGNAWCKTCKEPVRAFGTKE